MKISQGIPLISEWHICGIGVNTVYIYKKLDETRDLARIYKSGVNKGSLVKTNYPLFAGLTQINQGCSRKYAKPQLVVFPDCQT